MGYSSTLRLKDAKVEGCCEDKGSRAQRAESMNGCQDASPISD
jgi:hypothetical protein